MSHGFALTLLLHNKKCCFYQELWFPSCNFHSLCPIVVVVDFDVVAAVVAVVAAVVVGALEWHQKNFASNRFFAACFRKKVKIIELK